MPAEPPSADALVFDSNGPRVTSLLILFLVPKLQLGNEEDAERGKRRGTMDERCEPKIASRGLHSRDELAIVVSGVDSASRFVDCADDDRVA